VVKCKNNKRTEQIATLASGIKEANFIKTENMLG
jgi:hypothetical protein